MGPFEAQLREFIRRLDFMEHEVRGHGRKLTAIRQNLRDADDTGIKAKLARLSGEVDGCASEGFPGATVAIYHHDTGVKLGELTCDADGLYAGRVGLDADPQDVDIVATPTGTYAARFDGPVVTPATLSVGANPVPPIVIPPGEGWCCGEADYFPGECTTTVSIQDRGCSSLPVIRFTARIYDPVGTKVFDQTSVGISTSVNGSIPVLSGTGTLEVEAVEASDRLVAISQPYTFQSTPKSVGVTQAIVAGFRCTLNKYYPIAETVHFTDPVFGAIDLVYGAANPYGMGPWFASKGVTVAGTPRTLLYQFQNPGFSQYTVSCWHETTPGSPGSRILDGSFQLGMPVAPPVVATGPLVAGPGGLYGAASGDGTLTE